MDEAEKIASLARKDRTMKDETIREELQSYTGNIGPLAQELMSRAAAEIERLQADNAALVEAVDKIAAYQRGGVIVVGTPEGDRDEMIGIARVAQRQLARLDTLISTEKNDG